MNKKELNALFTREEDGEAVLQIVKSKLLQGGGVLVKTYDHKGNPKNTIRATPNKAERNYYELELTRHDKLGEIVANEFDIFETLEKIKIILGWCTYINIL